jgi:hypothetical protein
MDGLLRIVMVLVVFAGASCEVSAAEADAAELAALIDEQIEARLHAEQILPAAQADNAEFLRRVYLDVHGVIPTGEEAARFLSDTATDKRVHLVDRLLADPRYGQYLADIWQGYLISPLADDSRRAEPFRVWLAERFNTATWDQITTELLTATGKMEDNPAVIYLIEGRHPRSVPDLTELTSRFFLGIRLSCAQCHDHPFVDWKQQDFWGMAAFFTQIQTPGKAKQVYKVGVKDDRKVTLSSLAGDGAPDGFVLRPATFLGGEELSPDRGVSHRAALAAWMVSPDNAYFARAIVNRTWWRLFGRGLVNPVDDMHAANPPSHPELLKLLSARFIESGFDLKYLTRAIVLSRTYQRTSRTSSAVETGKTAEKQVPDRDVALFGRMPVKVLSPGQLYDSLATIFGPPAKKRGGDPRLSLRAEFVQFFGDDGDPDSTEYRRGIPHLLRLMNSGQFSGYTGSNLYQRVAAADDSPDAVARDMFLTVLTRQPTDVEQQIFREYVAASEGSLKEAKRELAWALMMTSEFSLNH